MTPESLTPRGVNDTAESDSALSNTPLSFLKMSWPHLAESPRPVFAGVTAGQGAGPLPDGRVVRPLLLHTRLPHHQLHPLLTPPHQLGSSDNMQPINC